MHHLARPRLRRLRGLRDDRRGADADRRGAPAASSSWPSSERPDGTTIIAGAGSNDTRHAVPPDRARDRARRRRDPLGHPVLQQAQPARASSPLRGGRAGDRQADRPLQHPRRASSSTCPTTCWPSWRRSTRIEYVKQANNDNLAPIDGLGIYAGNDEILARTLDMGGRGGILVASHVVGDEMRRMVDEPEQPGRDRRLAAATSTQAMGVTTNPIPRQGRAEHARPSASAACACRSSRPTRTRRRPIRAMLERHGLLRGRHEHRRNGKLRVLPLGGLGEIGKNMTVVEYDGRDRRRRRRPALPDGRAWSASTSCCPTSPTCASASTDIEGIVITHGHEDHLGALPWVLRELGEPTSRVFGGPLTMAMARSKLDEHRLKEIDARRRRARARRSSSGPFDDRAGPHDALDPRRRRPSR